MASKNRKPSTKLAAGRPPAAKKPQASLSSQATRTTIRTFHQLSKELKAAQAKGNLDAVADIEKRINDLGGLKAYQQASIQGQAIDRGGDSSATLMKWLEPQQFDLTAAVPNIRLLEVGALSTKNACSKSGLFDITRIDLNSQSEGITQQDFMDRPIPNNQSQCFDVISLSLVLNFVPDAEGRGKMIKRTCHFLDKLAASSMPTSLAPVFPALFMVLPAPSVLNSRYLTEERLTLMMASLGYVLLRRKQTAKLIYYLWQLRDVPVLKEQYFPKQQVRQGGSRNNFCIVLR